MPTLPQAALASPREAQRDVALSTLLGVLSLAAWAALWAWSASPYARYAAHGGWFVHDAGQPASVAIARATQKSRRQLLSLAAAAETHSPALSAELRNLASK